MSRFPAPTGLIERARRCLIHRHPGPIRKILTHLGEPLEPPPVSPARGPPTDWGEFVQAHFRPGTLSGVARRAARHRYPQPLTAFHATVRTAREKSGFKAGSSRREKSGRELWIRKLRGASTIGPRTARPTPAVAPRDPPRSAVACRSTIGRPILNAACHL